MGTLWNRKRKKRKKEIRDKKVNDRLIKDRIIRDITTLFEKEDDYYKPKRVSNFQSNYYIKYESNLSLDKYLNKIKPYLKNIITNLQNSHT